MPFKSERQRRYLWSNKPELAKKWAHKYGTLGKRRSKRRGAKTSS